MSNAKETVKEYSNGEITVVWKPQLCMHAKKCWHNLPDVFQPTSRPWVNMDGASTDAIQKQVQACPSGALSFYRNDEKTDSSPAKTAPQTTISILENGPLIISGNLSIEFSDGSTKDNQEKAALCRCGASSNKPFCDGSHKKVDFRG